MGLKCLSLVVAFDMTTWPTCVMAILSTCLLLITHGEFWDTWEIFQVKSWGYS